MLGKVCLCDVWCLVLVGGNPRVAEAFGAARVEA